MHDREKQFADLLTKQGRKWEYPSRKFQMGKTSYRPDFFLPDEDIYIEVVGTRQAYFANKEKIAKFRELYPNVKLFIYDHKGEVFPPKPKKRVSKVKISGYKDIFAFGKCIAKIPIVECYRCGHRWIPKKEEIRRCAKCKSPYWDVPRKDENE